MNLEILWGIGLVLLVLFIGYLAIRLLIFFWQKLEDVWDVVVSVVEALHDGWKALGTRGAIGVIIGLLTLIACGVYWRWELWGWVVANWKTILGFIGTVILPPTVASIVVKGTYWWDNKETAITGGTMFGVLTLLFFIFGGSNGGALNLLVAEICILLPSMLVFHLVREKLEKSAEAAFVVAGIVFVGGLVVHNYRIPILETGGTHTKALVEVLKTGDAQMAGKNETEEDRRKAAAERQEPTVVPTEMQGEKELGPFRAPDPYMPLSQPVDFSKDDAKRELFEAMIPRAKVLLEECHEEVAKVEKLFVELRQMEKDGILSMEGEGGGEKTKFFDKRWTREWKRWGWRVPMDTGWYTVVQKSGLDKSYSDVLYRAKEYLILIETRWKAPGRKVTALDLDKLVRIHDFAARELGYGSDQGLLKNGMNPAAPNVRLLSEFRRDLEILLEECRQFKPAKK